MDAGSAGGLNRRQRARSGARLLVALVVGALAGTAPGAKLGWSFFPLVGWVVAAIVFLVWTWTAVWPLDADDTRELSRREDPSLALADGVLLSTAVVALLAVVLVIFRASHSAGTAEPLRLGLGVAAVVSSWGVVHTIFALKYARLYYAGEPGGIDFNQDAQVRYADFAYVALTVGMTFQVSDTDIRDPGIRTLILRHALLSYLFGAVIIAVTINLVAGLSK
jgi:uncharacterized membrane protein